MPKLKEIHTLEEWKEIKSDYATEEIVVFKYSPLCPISASVERDFDNWFSKLPEEQKLSCVKINVVDSRPLSRALAESFKVNHQSPQVIWLTNNLEVKWHASHYDISSRSLSANLKN